MKIFLTEKAAAEVKRIIAENAEEGDDPVFLRLAVKGGGCSGFEHKLDLDPEFKEGKDTKLEPQHGVEIVVDRVSALYVDGATVDYHDGLNARGFKVTNPVAKTTCGCGSSFSM